ncbi:MAG: XrtA system polysaccharide deacetylase [Bryobacteraceae bacterium]|jgi:polysaccharide deacetylase family protein (PEP-CTERM system associated)
MNVLSVDVEDYFQVEAFSDLVDRSCWEGYACRVEANTRRVLELLAECGVRGTFFLLGWVAERYPGLVREIVAAGHEPACHSYWHRLVYHLNATEFREDTLRAKQVIEQAAGRAVYGYRAPSFSITRESLWAFQVLVECGFRYDSSVFPIRHDLYGIPRAPRFPFRIATPSGTLVEYPSTTFRLLGQNLPVGGGGYLRILPFWYTRLGLRRAKEDRLPLIVYVHPWETDPEQPRLKGRFRSRLRHYTNLKKTCARLRRLLGSDKFTSFETSALEEGAREVVSLAALQ